MSLEISASQFVNVLAKTITTKIPGLVSIREREVEACAAAVGAEPEVDD